MRTGCIQALASALSQRYDLTSQVDDLEQSILHYTEAIFLPPHWDRRCPNIAQNLFSTAQLLFFRAVHNMPLEPEDVKRPIIYLRYLHGQSPEAFNIPPDVVKDTLVNALAQQVVLGFGDVMQDIEEIADLFLELLNSATWTNSTVAIGILAKLVRHLHGRWDRGKEPPAKVIDCLRKAKSRLPDSDELSITFSCTLLDRFLIGYSNDDYEEGTVILDKILTSHTPGDDPSQYGEALRIIGTFAKARFVGSEKPEHLEEAIYRIRNWLHWIPLEDPDRPYLVSDLTFLQSLHFKDFDFWDLQKNRSFDSAFSGQPSFWDVIAPLQSPSMATGRQRLYARFSRPYVKALRTLPFLTTFGFFFPTSHFHLISFTFISIPF